VRKCAIGSLRIIADDRAVPVLLRTLANTHAPASVRAEAAEALGAFRRPDVLRHLLKGARDRSPQVRFFSVFSLGRLGAVEALPILRKLAKHDSGRVRTFGSVRREAREAIARIQESS
jgi:HEAT repeat protein